MVRGDARERRAGNLDLEHFNARPDEHVIYAQERETGGKRRQGSMGLERTLSIAEPPCQTPVDARLRNGIEISEQDHRMPTFRMPEPVGSEDRFGLRLALARDEPEMGIDDLDMHPTRIDRSPQGAAWFHAPNSREAGERTRPHEPGRAHSEDRIPVQLLHDPKSRVEMEGHAEFLSDRVGLIDPSGPDTPDIELLKGHDVGLTRSHDLGDARR